jgi:coenzyme F420-reducing hydrogenase delta subunit
VLSLSIELKDKDVCILEIVSDGDVFCFLYYKEYELEAVLAETEMKDNRNDMEKTFIPKLTLMYCINSFSEKLSHHENAGEGVEIKFVKLPCSSMVKDVYILRAFEAGSDAVVIFVCPEGHCRYVEGNLRAKKRIAWVQNLLDEIGLGGERLTLHHVSVKDGKSAETILQDTLKNLYALGPSPARSCVNQSR